VDLADWPCSIFHRVLPLARAVLTLPSIRWRVSNFWASIVDTFFSTKVTT
jgi:hypothetical protein